MPYFSKKSLEKLSTCHPDLQLIFKEVINLYDCTITEGFRNEQDQNKAFLSGKSKLKFPYGKHNKFPSMAVDVYPCPIDFSNKKSFHDLYLIVKNVSIRLKKEGHITHIIRWGGAWDGSLNKFGQLDDLCHFELI